jgi:hypothetical protein
VVTSKKKYIYIVYTPEYLFQLLPHCLYTQGNGNTEKEQIIKEFEHIHNKSIFDTFNEALNLMRPFYSLGGPPYSWSQSERALAYRLKTEDDLSLVFEKSSRKVIEWAAFLCGLLIDGEDEPTSSETREIHFDPNRPLASLMENMPPEHECITQVREEKLSKMLLTEVYIYIYIYKLNLYFFNKIL